MALRVSCTPHVHDSSPRAGSPTKNLWSLGALRFPTVQPLQQLLSMRHDFNPLQVTLENIQSSWAAQPGPKPVRQASAAS